MECDWRSAWKTAPRFEDPKAAVIASVAVVVAAPGSIITRSCLRFPMHALSSVTLGNRGEMFNLLFRSVWRSLKKVIEDKQQFEAAAAIVPDRWK